MSLRLNPEYEKLLPKMSDEELISNVALALIELHAADDGMLPNPFRDKTTEDLLE